jgi:hypothetical protein
MNPIGMNPHSTRTRERFARYARRVRAYVKRTRERAMTLFKITKLIHDKTGIFINPIDLKPKMMYLTIKARINRGRE